MMLMREGVRGVYALYYTHRGGIFNTTCDWLKNKPPETKEGPASGLCVALQSQLFSLGGRSSERPALQASKCSTLPRPFCTLLFVYSHPGGKDPTRGWLGLRLWCIESCSFGLQRMLCTGCEKRQLEARFACCFFFAFCVWRLRRFFSRLRCVRSSSWRGRKAWLRCVAAWSARTPRFYAPAVTWTACRARVDKECARGTLTNMAEMCATRVSRCALLFEQRHFDSGKHSCLCFPALLMFIIFFCIV